MHSLLLILCVLIHPNGLWVNMLLDLHNCDDK